MSNDTDGKCPVMHGGLTSNSASGASNRDWWPNQLNLNILHQHDQKITEFKVFIRPLQAVNALHQKMGAILESMETRLRP